MILKCTRSSEQPLETMCLIRAATASQLLDNSHLLFIIVIIRFGQTHLIYCPVTLPILGVPIRGQPSKRCGPTEGGGTSPHNEVEPLARGDGVGTMALAAEMEHGAADRVRVRGGGHAVVGAAEAAAELEPRAAKLSSEANIERHFRSVVVHVESLGGG